MRTPVTTDCSTRPPRTAGLDVLWQCRSDDTGKFSDDWETIERFEAREYQCRHERSAKARYVR